MPQLTLEGDTLGKKHQHYNKLVKDAIDNKHYELSEISGDDSDIDNLLKIDIASKTRNVNFIIEVLKCNDMLYVSRAIKKSTWLITDPQYAAIINPEYLYTKLFPSMNTKAINKLMLHIRLNLKDENRVESFYEYHKHTNEGYKWLQNCSIPFTENVIQHERHIPLSFFKRLCKKSDKFLPYCKRVEKNCEYTMQKELLHFLKSHTNEILNILEDPKNYNRPVIGQKKTEFLMKTCPERILGKLETYISCIELSVVAKYIKKEDIKAFLYKQTINKNLAHYFTNYNNLKYFIQKIPTEEKVEFIKKHLIDKTSKLPRDKLTTFCSEEEICYVRCNLKETYNWYEYLPFNVAFTDMKNLLRAENSPSERCAMLSVLIKCAKKNPENIKTLLNYFYEKHINEAFKFKIQFVNNLLIEIPTHELDLEAWNILDRLFHSMEVYTESENKIELCLKSIIVYKVLHDEPIPDIVEKKTSFYTFKKIQKKLNHEQKDKIFTYLLNSVLAKITTNIANESDFNKTINQVKNALNLLIDWKKSINNYPVLLNKIRELIILKKDNSWYTNLSDLYNMKKSWRKYMFEESLSLFLCEETCLNALKHKPQLLTRYDEHLKRLRSNDSVSLQSLLAKIRIYWSDSLTQYWITAYLQNLNNPTGRKAHIRGLFMLLPQKQLIDMAKKHVPDDFKVNWGNVDETQISIRKYIAKYLHVARPLIPLDTVLWYAKGDYLQYAVPSINAVIHYLSKNESREHVSKLLEAPVSLQKFGLHLAFNKLRSDELKPLFSQIWKTTKNSSIRSVLFMHTFTMICKAKDETLEKELWELLSMFIDNLTAEDSKEMYKILGKPEKVPLSIKAQFYMKSYNFLTSLPEKVNCERIIMNLVVYAPAIMELLDADFVGNKLLSPAETKFCTSDSSFIEILTCFILCGKTEEEQLQRFHKILQPVMDLAFQSWDSTRDEDFHIKNNFNICLQSLVWNLRKYVTLNRPPIPVKLFVEIQTILLEYMVRFSLLENYVMYTNWKLITEYVKIMAGHKSLFSVFESQKVAESDIGSRWMPDEIENVWKQIHFELSPILGPAIVKCLQEDIDQYFPTIYSLFNVAFKNMFETLCYYSYEYVLETLKYMLDDDNFIPSFLVVCNAIPLHTEQEHKSARSEIRRKIKSHPSTEVRMHYYCVFQGIPEDS